MFTDDNWGNNQRLPLANETARSGGVGVSSPANSLTAIGLMGS